MEVLGKPEPESESGNEDDSEEICGSNERQRDQDFDDDFCMHFLNNNAFSSNAFI